MKTKEIERRYGRGFHAPVLSGEAELGRRFVNAWGNDPNAQAVFRVLKSAYSQSHRHFHNLQHIEECLQIVEQYAAIVGWGEVPGELELALWFHDVVYDPGAQDNEHRSAELFQSLAREGGLKREVIEGVISLILETKDHDARGVQLSTIMCDADLWILGSPAERYREYARQVREEHSPYANWEYRWGRRRFLRGMLRRKSLYANPLFEGAFAAQARENMEWELENLKKGRPGTLEVIQKKVPGLTEYFVISQGRLTGGTEDEEEFFFAAHREARELARERYGDPSCYSLIYNGATLRRRSWPHFHVVLARTRKQKRLRLFLLWLKGPLGLLEHSRLFPSHLLRARLGQSSMFRAKRSLLCG